MDGTEFKVALKRSGKTGKWLADHFGISDRAVRFWEVDGVPVGKIAEVRKLLGVDIDLASVEELDLIRELERRAFERRRQGIPGGQGVNG